MASHVPKSSPVEAMMKDLKVDPLATITGTVSAKERSQSDAISRVSSASEDVKSGVVEGAPDYESLETYQGLPCPFGGYYGFYYPGLEGSVGETKDQVYYCSGTELQYPIMQGENGSLIYFMPGINPYDASNAYFPANPVGVDAQYASQTLHSSAPMFAPHGYLPNAFGYGDLVSPTYLWDPTLFIRDSVFANTPGLKQNISSSSHGRGHHAKYKTSFSSLNAFSGHGTGEQFKTSSKASQQSSARQPDIQGRGYFPFTTIPLYNQERSGMFYRPNSVGKKAGALDGVATEKDKARSKANSNSISDSANSQDIFIDGGGAPSNSAATVIRRDQYNLPDFQTKYGHAFFFVIKSYSEDDIHKSIKYNVWSSTPNGNKKLDSAYQEAQKRITEHGGKCPVFLFFSVNASGQFCGVAEMIGQVDFEKSMNFWQQDKWTGYFPVKWHIVKDVPNPHLRHIILENNEHKPVTNSRDTQEVRLPQGNELLAIFKNYVAKTSILDDFEFYESREKVMLQKRLRSPVPNVAQTKTMNISTAKKIMEAGEGKRDKDKDKEKD